MDIYTATEQAYKNGYEAGVKKFAELIKKELGIEILSLIDSIAKEMVNK